MSIREAIEIFDHFWDKYRDEGVTNYEKVRHINTGMFNYVRREFAREYERGSTVSERFTQLIKEDIEVRTNSKGHLLHSLIEVEMPVDTVLDEDGGIVSNSRCEVLGVLRMQRWSGSEWEPVEFVRLNDWAGVIRDPFERPSEEYPKWCKLNSRIEVLPKGIRDIRVDAMRMPVHCHLGATVAEDVDLELSYSMSLDVISEALRYAGINTRDKDLYEYTINENRV